MPPAAVSGLRLQCDFRGAKRSYQVPFALDVAAHVAAVQIVVVASTPVLEDAAVPVVVADAVAAGVTYVVLVSPAVAAAAPAARLVLLLVVLLYELALFLFRRLSCDLEAIVGAESLVLC